MIILRCSFCGDMKETESLVAGPQAIICDRCVAGCADILSDGPAARWLRECGEAEYASWSDNRRRR